MLTDQLGIDFGDLLMLTTKTNAGEYDLRSVIDDSSMASTS